MLLGEKKRALSLWRGEENQRQAPPKERSTTPSKNGYKKKKKKQKNRAPLPEKIFRRVKSRCTAGQPRHPKKKKRYLL